MRGRKPLPENWHIVTGGRRGKKGAKEEKPREAVKLRPPPNLSDAALDVWPEIVAGLNALGVLDAADRFAVGRLCATFVEVVEAEQEIERCGRYQDVTTQSGATMTRLHPAVGVLQDADRRLRAWLTEYGLTASSRTRLKVSGDKPNKSPASKYFA